MNVDNEDIIELSDIDRPTGLSPEFVLVGKDPSTAQIAHQVAMHLMDKERFLVLSENSPIWRYDPNRGIWKPNGKEYIQQQVVRLLQERYTTHIVNEVVSRIRGLAYAENVKLNNVKNKIVVRNGTLNLDTGELEDFNPDEYHITRLDVEYNPDISDTTFIEFLNSILDEKEDIDAIIEHLGHCLVKEPSSNILLFVGEGANGKSILLETIKGFLGQENVSTATLQQLEERFTAAFLFGKLANISADLPRNALKTTGIIKMLTGGDAIKAEKKYQDSFVFVNYAKLWFSANEVPMTWDDGFAFHRRMRIIEFTKTFLPNSPDYIPREELLNRLLSEESKSTILNLAIEGLKRLRKQNYNLSGNKSVEERRNEYLLRSDPIKFFVNEFIEPVTDWNNQQPIPKSTLYEAYRTLCFAIKRPATTPNHFSNRLKALLPYLQDGRPETDEGKRVRVWYGITINYEKLSSFIKTTTFAKNRESQEEQGQEKVTRTTKNGPASRKIDKKQEVTSTTSTSSTSFLNVGNTRDSKEKEKGKVEIRNRKDADDVDVTDARDDSRKNESSKSMKKLNANIIMAKLVLMGMATEYDLRTALEEMGYTRDEFEKIFTQMKESDPRLGKKDGLPVYYYVKHNNDNG